MSISVHDEHGHSHAHGHAHDDAAEPGRKRPRAHPALSPLARDAGSRLLRVGFALAVLWVAVGWALGWGME